MSQLMLRAPLPDATGLVLLLHDKATWSPDGMDALFWADSSANHLDADVEGMVKPTYFNGSGTPLCVGGMKGKLSHTRYSCLCVCVYICIYICVCVCVCVRHQRALRRWNRIWTCG